MTEKERLINELEGMRFPLNSTQRERFGKVADFIIKDRRRTIEEYKITYFCDCDKSEKRMD